MVKMKPITEEVFNQMLIWAEMPEHAEFFRRFPPVCDWGTWERARPMLQSFYGIYEEYSLVGVASFNNFDFHAKSNEIGVLVDCPNRKEVARETLVQLCNYGFDYLSNNKIVARIMKHRVKLAARMAEHGFKQEGLLRSSCNGQDEILLGCLKSEFNEKGI